MGHRGDVPTSNVLIEGGGAVEHDVHVSHRGDIPGIKWLVEGSGAVEHLPHGSYRGGIPRGDVLVEGDSVMEHIVHVGHRGSIPRGDITVEGGRIPEHLRHVGDAREVGGVGRPVGHVGCTVEGALHADPRAVAPLFDRGQAGPADTIVQVESLQVAGDDDGVCARLLVGVGLWAGDTAGGGAIAPVNGHAGSADGQLYCLVGPGGGPSGDKGVVGDIKKWVNVLYSGNLNNPVVATANEVGSGGGDVDRVDGAEGDVLAGLESEGCFVDHLKEVGVGAGDAVDWVVVSQHQVLRHDVADRPFIVGDGQIDQGDIPGPQVLVEGVGASEHPDYVGDRGDIPGRDVLVEGGCAGEHTKHARHRGDIPGGDVTVEGGGIGEHHVHYSHRGDIPAVEWLVEGGSSCEHHGHVVHRGYVPAVEWLVEGGGAREHLRHIRHRGDIPGGDVTVEGDCIPKHPGHVGDAREVGGIGCLVNHVGGAIKGRLHGNPRYVAPLVY